MASDRGPGARGRGPETAWAVVVGLGFPEVEDGVPRAGGRVGRNDDQSGIAPLPTVYDAAAESNA
jgi:hypothetical protein